MAAADTARLIASLELNSSKFVSGMNKANSSLGKIEGRLGAFSGFVNRNLGRALDRAASIGINALTDGIKGGIDSLSQLEDATTAVSGAIKQTGMTGQVTAAQIAQWANEIEASTQAAFDDKDITRNAATLIRYGKVTTANLRPALQVMTDLAAKTGSVDSAASSLAKALADPAKAAGVLKRAGVVLTKQQQDQIKALMKAGKVGKAQALILQLLGKATKGAAKDSKGAFGDMQNQLNDTVEDAQRLLATAAMPVLQKIGTKLTEALADPRTMDAIKRIGEGAAGALDKIIAFAEKVPWGSIADGLGKAAGFAGDLLNAFSHIPPEAQAFIIGLAGLNKISGGAISGIVGELGKGLIKGVLGMTAGIVNINAGVVKGPGGGPPGAPAPGGGPGGGPSTGPGVGAGPGVKAGGTAGIFITDMHQFNSDLAGELRKNDTHFAQVVADRLQERANKDTPWDQILIALGLQQARKNQPADNTTGMQDFRAGERQSWTEPLKAIGTKQDEARATFEGSMKAVDATAGTGLRNVDNTARSGLSGATAATNNAAARISAAVVASRPIVTTTVNVTVTPTNVQKATTTATRYGPTNGSQGGGTGTGSGSKYD